MTDEAANRQKRLARAVTTFVVLSVDEDYETWRRELGATEEQAVRDAIRAMRELCDLERRGPMASPQVRARMRELLTQMEDTLCVEGVTDDARRIARLVVQMMFPDARRWFDSNPQR